MKKIFIQLIKKQLKIKTSSEDPVPTNEDGV